MRHPRLNLGQEQAELATHVGGVRLPFALANFGWPQARLTMFSEGFRIGPSCFLFFYVPRRSYRYEDLTEVQAVGNSILNLGIRFRTRRTEEWVIFWSINRARRAELLNNFEQHVPAVNVAPLPFSIFRAFFASFDDDK